MIHSDANDGGGGSVALGTFEYVEDAASVLAAEPALRPLECVVCHGVAVEPVRVPHMPVDPDCGVALCAACHAAWARHHRATGAEYAPCPVCRRPCPLAEALRARADPLLLRIVGHLGARCVHCGWLGTAVDMTAHHRGVLGCPARTAAALRAGHPNVPPFCLRQWPCGGRVGTCRWGSTVLQLRGVDAAAAAVVARPLAIERLTGLFAAQQRCLNYDQVVYDAVGVGHVVAAWPECAYEAWVAAGGPLVPGLALLERWLYPRPLEAAANVAAAVVERIDEPLAQVVAGRATTPNGETGGRWRLSVTESASTRLFAACPAARAALEATVLAGDGGVERALFEAFLRCVQDGILPSSGGPAYGEAEARRLVTAAKDTATVGRLVRTVRDAGERCRGMLPPCAAQGGGERVGGWVDSWRKKNSGVRRTDRPAVVVEEWRAQRTTAGCFPLPPTVVGGPTPAFAYSDAVATVVACREDELAQVVGEEGLMQHCAATPDGSTPVIVSCVLYAAVDHVDWQRWRGPQGAPLRAAAARLVTQQVTVGCVMALPPAVAMRTAPQVDAPDHAPAVCRSQGHRLIMLHRRLPRRSWVDTQIGYLILVLLRSPNVWEDAPQQPACVFPDETVVTHHALLLDRLCAEWDGEPTSQHHPLFGPLAAAVVDDDEYNREVAERRATRLTVVIAVLHAAAVGTASNARQCEGAAPPAFVPSTLAAALWRACVWLASVWHPGCGAAATAAAARAVGQIVARETDDGRVLSLLPGFLDALLEHDTGPLLQRLVRIAPAAWTVEGARAAAAAPRHSTELCRAFAFRPDCPADVRRAVVVCFDAVADEPGWVTALRLHAIHPRPPSAAAAASAASASAASVSAAAACAWHRLTAADATEADLATVLDQVAAGSGECRRRLLGWWRAAHVGGFNVLGPVVSWPMVQAFVLERLRAFAAQRFLH